MRPKYLTFREPIQAKSAIKTTLEADEHLQDTISQHYQTLENWWQVAKDDFAKLGDGKKMPEVRRELLTGLKKQLIPLKVLDEFKSAGVFVNWWQQIRYDLKTIINTGWHHSLIPDDYLIAEFFQTEIKTIEDLESKISAAQAELSEAIESAQEVVSYEPEEDKAVSAKVMKDELKALIDDLKETAGASAMREYERYKTERDGILKLENRIKTLKSKLKEQETELEDKLRLKRVGDQEFKVEKEQLIEQINERLVELDPNKKNEKTKINALIKDKTALEKRLKRIDDLMVDIGGQLTPEAAKTLILKKLYDWVKEQLTRYLNIEKRSLIALVEKFWDKYAVSSQELEAEREETLKTLNDYLSKLGYLG